EPLVQELQAPAPPGALRTQALARRLRLVGRRLCRVEALLELAVAGLGGRQLVEDEPLALGDPLELAADLLLLGAEGLLLAGEPAVTPGGVLLARLGDRLLLAELGDLALEAVGVPGERRALADQALELGAGLGEGLLEPRQGGGEVGQLPLAL